MDKLKLTPSMMESAESVVNKAKYAAEAEGLSLSETSIVAIGKRAVKVTIILHDHQGINE